MVTKRLGDRVVQLREITCIHGMPVYADNREIAKAHCSADNILESENELECAGGSIYLADAMSVSKASAEKITAFWGVIKC